MRSKEQVDLSHNPINLSSNFHTILHKILLPEQKHVRSDVTTWRWAFLLWKKPEEEMSKMADDQFGKLTTDFELFSSLLQGKIYFFLILLQI